ncbi:MAG: hypothetical protein KDI82_15710, partial [Gammaproteobacteria bacterium]|nr:hypothetical protein [Gammaproteobacteria bacterium]
QHRLAAGIEESTVMPSVKDLPEHLRGAEFRERFGHVGSPEYHALMQEIEDRIGTLSFYSN